MLFFRRCVIFEAILRKSSRNQNLENEAGAVYVFIVAGQILGQKSHQKGLDSEGKLSNIRICNSGQMSLLSSIYNNYFPLIPKYLFSPRMGKMPDLFSVLP